MKINKDIFEKDDLNEIFYGLMENHFPDYDEDSFELLDEVSKTFVLISVMDGQIHNGGVIQFIDNGSGNYFHETIDAAQKIGCDGLVQLLEKAASQFPENKIPKDWNERRDLIDDLNEQNSIKVTFAELDNHAKERFLENHDPSIPLNEIEIELESEWGKVWGELDNWYYENYLDIYKSLFEYLKENATVE